ncbi:MAG TPA: cupin domain-containing protein [Anaerolineae bacterium]|nr:cupin domain-containing protein [Anaerolineae bacterium]
MMRPGILVPQPALSLGGKIRQRRKAKKLTLSELASQCNISPSFLSQIERDQAKPSVGTLHNIADQLGVTLAEFFDDAQGNNDNGAAKPAAPLAEIVRADRRKVLVYPNSGIRNELVSPDLKRDIQMMRVVMPPGESTGDVPLVHEGEECGLVVQGTVEVWVGDEYYVLGPGDAIYQKSTIPHRSRNIGDTEAIVIVAITPPSF